jgi:hypothetical protein
MSPEFKKLTYETEAIIRRMNASLVSLILQNDKINANKSKNL